MSANDSALRHNQTKDLQSVRLTPAETVILFDAATSLLFWHDFIGGHLHEALHHVEHLCELGLLVEFPYSGWKTTYAGNYWLYINGYMASLLELTEVQS